MSTTTRDHLALRSGRLPLTALIAEHAAMEETLASGRISETPEEPVYVKARPDLSGKWEIADGHHRVAAAIRGKLPSVAVLMDQLPDDEPYDEPFYPFVAPVLPEWADEALEGVYAGQTLYVQQQEERCITFRRADGALAGYLNWGGWDPTIGSVYVHRDLRRLGLATELLRRAREVEPDLQHSTSLSADAQAWIAALGEQDRCKRPR